LKKTTDRLALFLPCETAGQRQPNRCSVGSPIMRDPFGPEAADWSCHPRL